MKSTIQILPERVANQIAAGEVVERPASVVKELVENSLDAGATRITVEFRQGGKRLIRIEDNGHGMSPDQAHLALERHATSKIRATEDLNAVMSFGFRGEALPSIASVSRFSLKTRSEGWEHGVDIRYSGGQHRQTRDTGMPVGTVVEVSQLFDTVPARRKFLKTDSTESAHIIHLCRLLAVAHPTVSFTLVEDGRVCFESPECPGLRDRIAEIFNPALAKELMPVEAEEGPFRLSGLIGQPGACRATRHDLNWYVNKRPVDSRLLNYALIESYHTYIPKGRYPIAFAFLEMDPQGLDVNVHPAKREVRMHDEPAVRRFVIESVLEALAKATGKMKASYVEPVAPIAPEVVGQKSEVISREASTPPEELKSDSSTPSVQNAGLKPKEQTRRLDWRFLGLSQGDYALFDSTNSLILLHIKAARARVLYEDYCQSLQEHSVARQTLLFPVQLEFDPMASELLAERISFFVESGFGLEPFGGSHFRLHSVPEWFDPEEAEALLRDTVDYLRENRIEGRNSLAQEHFARIATRRTANQGSVSGHVQLTSLAQRLMSCKNPLADPDGRPTIQELSQSELARRFARR